MLSFWALITWGQGTWAPAVPLDLHLPDNIFPMLFSYRETSLAKCVMTEAFSTKLSITWIALTSQDLAWILYSGGRV